ncbi:MAG: CBS domain-containing protein [Oscillospiraceae bacterium]|nr:CBS domain-containing protein [Oscillospiraceae bacterium]
MQLKDIMQSPVIAVHPGESVEVAARTMTQYNIGFLPVCSDGRLCGVVTDRDMVTRCLAAGKNPGKTPVSMVMTRQVVTAGPEMQTGVAAHLMGRRQIRRLPVVESGRLQGMVSLGDIAAQGEGAIDAGDALGEIACGSE